MYLFENRKLEFDHATLHSRIFKMLECLAILLALVLPAAHALGDTLVENPDFSGAEGSSIPGWQVPGDWIQAEARQENGERFVRIRNTNPQGVHNIYQVIDLPPRARTLLIVADMRSDNIKPADEPWETGRVNLQFLDEDGGDMEVYGAAPTLTEPTDGWRRVPVVREVPEGARRLRLQPGIWRGVGEVDFKHIRVDVTEESIVRRPQFREHAKPMLDPVKPATGASEWLENFTEFNHFLRVDPNDAQALPTIGQAIREALKNRVNGEATRIVVASGVYRVESEELIIIDQPDRHGRAVIAIEAETPGEVIIKGSELFTEWRELEDGIYVHHWDKAWGFNRHWWVGLDTVVEIDPVVHRRENIWIDGERQRQVLLERDGQLVRSRRGEPVETDSNSWMVLPDSGPRRPYSELEPGTFYVDEEASLLVLRPKPGAGPTQSEVEVSTATYGLALVKTENFILRGLTIEHFASTLGLRDGVRTLWDVNQNGTPLTLRESANVLLEDIILKENNLQALTVSTLNDVTLRRVNSSDNGGTGIGGGSLINVLFEDVVANRNNWRGDWGRFHDWHQAGIKLTGLEGSTLRNITTNDNRAHGFWFDIHANETLIDTLVSKGNLRAGAYIEMLGGPVQMVNSTLEDNGMGLLLSATANFTLENSRIVGNGTQISMRDDNRIHAVNFAFRNNLIASSTTLRDPVHEYRREDGRRVAANASGDERIMFYQYWVADFDGFGVEAQPLIMPRGATAWKMFLETLTAEGNTWYHPSLRHAFLDADRWPVDFDAWKELTGDKTARWENPLDETEDWRQRTDAVSDLEKPGSEARSGVDDYTVTALPEWPEPGILRINCGAEQPYTDGQGRLWLSDRWNANGGQFTAVSERDLKITRNTINENPPVAIAESNLATLYATERYSLDGYVIAASKGSYTLRLHFSENHEPLAAGERLFHIDVNGERVIENLDVLAEAGGQGRPLVKEVNGILPQADRILIEFKRPIQSRQLPMINAIEVIHEE